jgi:hypothetical protein
MDELFFLVVPVDPSIYPDYVQYQKSNFRIFRPSEQQGLFIWIKFY